MLSSGLPPRPAIIRGRRLRHFCGPRMSVLNLGVISRHRDDMRTGTDDTKLEAGNKVLPTLGIDSRVVFVVTLGDGTATAPLSDQSTATTGSGPLIGLVDRVRATWLGMGWCSSWCRTFHTEVLRWRAMAGTPTPGTMSSWITLGSTASGGVPGRVRPSRRVSGAPRSEAHS